VPAESRIEIERLRQALDQAAARERAQDERLRALAGELELARAEARSDALTGALNRLGLEEAWAREASRTERAGEPLSLVVLDLDDFKRLNDERGHAAGDRALVLLADLARAVLRSGDGVARLGGEEFALLLSGVDAARAACVASRLAQALAGGSAGLGGPAGRLTFSAGVAVREPGERLPRAIERADRALYAAKRLGKDRILAAEPTVPVAA
jgi:diguanylate cyclase (GGDEF)-like protein